MMFSQLCVEQAFIGQHGIQDIDNTFTVSFIKSKFWYHLLVNALPQYRIWDYYEPQ
jgi:hypothetical protein